VATRVFSKEELAQLRGFPEITRDELIRFFTLTAADRAFVDPGRGRSPRDRLGLAIQLCTLPWLGFVPDDVTTAPPAAVARLAPQLQVAPEDLDGYGVRGQTRTDHLRLVLQYAGWQTAGMLAGKELEEFLLARAMEHDSPSLLFRLACEHLRSSKVVRPGVVTLLERVAAARAAAVRETFDRLAHLLTEARRAELDVLLVTDPQIGTSRLRWLNTGPTEASAAAVKPRSGNCCSCAVWMPTPWTCRCCRPSAVGSSPGSGAVRRWPNWPGGIRNAGIRSCSHCWPSRRPTCSMRWCSCSTRPSRRRSRRPSTS
jgi:hypothetical protein